jgi:hypothetical protein
MNSGWRVYNRSPPGYQIGSVAAWQAESNPHQELYQLPNRELLQNGRIGAHLWAARKANPLLVVQNTAGYVPSGRFTLSPIFGASLPMNFPAAEPASTLVTVRVPTED